MKTISVSDLKTHLSAELKKVKAGETVVVLDHRHPDKETMIRTFLSAALYVQRKFV